MWGKHEQTKRNNILFHLLIMLLTIRSIIFSAAQPTEAELAVFNKVKIVLEKCQAIIKDMQQYTGATESIRQVRKLHLGND